MFIIGIDGGGTSTQGTLASLTLVPIETAQVGATNYHNVGRETAKQRIGELVSRLLDQAGISFDQLSGICMGGAGIDSLADQQVIEDIFKEIGWHGPLVAVNDAVTALAGGNRNLEGAVVISGTGSIAYGCYGGKTARSGGWGQLIDDVGSGYHLGISALKGIMEAYDGRRGATKLWAAVAAHLGIQKEEDIIHFLYHPQTGKEKIAELAPIVIQLSEEDPLAAEIITDAARGLTALLDGLFSQLDGLPSNPALINLSVTVGGSLLTKSPKYRAIFQASVLQKYPSVNVHLPYEGPVAGALRIIKEYMEKERETHA